MTNAKGTSPGRKYFRSQTVLAAAIAVRAKSGAIHGLNVINTNAAKAYLKFYNVAAASVTVGTTVPQHVLEIPASGSLLIPVASSEDPLFHFSTALAVAATTTHLDAGNTALGAALHVEIQHA